MSTIKKYFATSGWVGQTVDAPYSCTIAAGDGSDACHPRILSSASDFQTYVVDAWSASHDSTLYQENDVLVLYFYVHATEFYELDDFRLGYRTSQGYLPVHFQIQSFDPNSTGQKAKFRLKANATVQTASQMYMVRTPEFIISCLFSGFEMDCNGPAQTPWIDTAGDHRVGAISIHGRDVTVDNCEIYDFLSKSDTSTHPVEAFPLALIGYNSSASPLFNLAVRNCYLHDLQSINLGYCTAIMIDTLDYEQSGQSNVYSQSYPSSSSSEDAFYLCFVEDNTARCLFPGGVGLGGRNLQRAVFRRNRVTKADAGFNLDTGPNPNDGGIFYSDRIVAIEDNAFEDVNRGVSLGFPSPNSSTDLSYWWIRRNNIVVRNLCDAAQVIDCEAFALRLQGGTSDIEFSSNKIGPTSNWSYSSSSSSCSSEPSPSSGTYYVGVLVKGSLNDTPDLFGNTDELGNSLSQANATNEKIMP